MYTHSYARDGNQTQNGNLNENLHENDTRARARTYYAYNLLAPE
jgi:hypothetical protein